LSTAGSGVIWVRLFIGLKTKKLEPQMKKSGEETLFDLRGASG
jgi:hypothetical protein